MNDLDARRLLMADPRHPPAALRAALERQASLRELRDELLRVDEQVRAEVTKAAVPHGLADRLVLGARYQRRSTLRFAIAAAIVSLAVALPWHATREADFQVAMMEHVRESAAELADNGGVDPGTLRTSLAGLGVDLRDAPLRVRHLGHCVVAGIQGRHFTVDGPAGVISFVLLPAHSRSAAESMEDGDTVGVFQQHGEILIGAFGATGMDPGKLRELVGRMFA